MGLTHFGAILFFAAMISVAFAFHSRDAARERAFYAVKSFVLFVGAAVLIGWLMYPISQ